MQRLKDNYLDEIESHVRLASKQVLEIGCGNGERTKKLAARGALVWAVDPDIEVLKMAKKSNSHKNITYLTSKAEHLDFADKSFAITLFTLSFHHVHPEQMETALAESVRVTNKDGHIIFLEPTEEGTFFEAEIIFDACDGDERVEKKIAHRVLKNYPNYIEVAEIYDEVILVFDSVQDYTDNFKPKKNVDHLSEFLKERNYTLNARRRINIFRV